MPVVLITLIGTVFFNWFNRCFISFDVSIYLTEVPLQLTRFSLQLMEALLYKFGVNLKHNLKVKNKLQCNSIFKCFPTSSLDKGRLFRQTR